MDLESDLKQEFKWLEIFTETARAEGVDEYNTIKYVLEALPPDKRNLCINHLERSLRGFLESLPEKEAAAVDEYLCCPHIEQKCLSCPNLILDYERYEKRYRA